MIYSVDQNYTQSLNEVYFGKTAIAPLQLQFSIFRKKFRGKPYSPKMSIDKDVLLFNRLCEKLFGYTTFALSISPDNSVNAYALKTILYQTDEEKKAMMAALTATNTGFKYTPKMGSICALVAVNIGTLNCDILTDEEILAILLHEIGHTFFESVSDKNCVYSLTSSLLGIAKEINNSVFVRSREGLLSRLNGTAISNEVNRMWRNASNGIRSVITNISAPIDFIKNNLYGNKDKMYTNMKPSMTAYTNEKFADTFAASYGYGTELQSALLKLTENYFKEHPIKQDNQVVTTLKMYDLYLADIIQYVLCIKDDHPDGLGRIKVSLEYIKRELANESIDPKMKRELMAQMNELDRIIDDFVNYPKDEDTMGYLRAYYILLYDKFGGDIRERDADNEALFSTIDSRYNELNNKK